MPHATPSRSPPRSDCRGRTWRQVQGRPMRRGFEGRRPRHCCGAGSPDPRCRGRCCRRCCHFQCYGATHPRRGTAPATWPQGQAPAGRHRRCCDDGPWRRDLLARRGHHSRRGATAAGTPPERHLHNHDEVCGAQARLGPNPCRVVPPPGRKGANRSERNSAAPLDPGACARTALMEAARAGGRCLRHAIAGYRPLSSAIRSWRPGEGPTAGLSCPGLAAPKLSPRHHRTPRRHHHHHCGWAQWWACP
mmetsp:Transcript_7650/g.16001  ORF Transcript_7650/g.16001 Transcript_7650/m.16001 type:complete len:248 (+) Transcript_7650:291-1034(+)